MATDVGDRSTVRCLPGEAFGESAVTLSRGGGRESNWIIGELTLLNKDSKYGI